MTPLELLAHKGQPMPPYFIIKIGKEEQRRRKEFLTQHIMANPGTVFMQREIQFGQIISIGTAAQEYMPMAEIGDYLLINHLITGKKTDNGYNFYIVDEDEDFNYYAVNAFEIPGEKALAYAVAKGEEIIPTPDYIFLEVPKPETDNDLMQVKVSENGLVVPKEKTKTRQEWIDIMQKNKKRCQLLANVLPQGAMEEIMVLKDPARKERLDFAIKEIKMLEAENLRISTFINKKRYEPFVVAAVNPQWNEYINHIEGEKIHPGEVAYFLNIATQYIFDFGGTEYIVADLKYFAGSEKYFKKGIAQFKQNFQNGSKLHRPTSKKGAAKIRN